MVEVLSKHIARKINEIVPESNSEVMEYELGVKLNMCLTIALTAAFGFVSGSVVDALFSLFALSRVRKYSGGFHFSSLTFCSFLSAVLFATAPTIEFSGITNSFVTVITILIFLKYSPNSFTGINKAFPDDLKRIISTSLVMSNLFLNSSTLTILFIVQAISILPWKGGEHVWNLKETLQKRFL